MSVPFHVIIPARFASSRLPGKLMMDLGGCTVIERVYRQALLAEPTSVIVATDNEQIFAEVERFGGEALMTSTAHPCGTDRLVEVIEHYKLPAESIVVNVQGDEPLMDPALIKQVAEGLHATTHPMYSLCWPIASFEEFANINVVKVVMNAHNEALFFSRSPIPFHRDAPDQFEGAYRHIGIYAYRSQFLRQWQTLPACHLEHIEMIEQLRALSAGYRIGMAIAHVAPKQDINTAEDLEMARKHCC